MFVTKVKIPNSQFKIEYNACILSIGSCFAENIGSKLDNACFKVDINPFGVQFNPLSIADNLNRLAEGILFSETDLNEKSGLHFSFAHSTLFSKTSKTETLDGINQRFSNAVNQLKSADVLLITFGTAWVYEYVETSEIVNNCHKIEASKFKRYRLEISQIVEVYKNLFAKINLINPKLEIIFSVSPVRHWKDGAHENTLSKSILHLSISELQSQFNNVHYFPAYEILIDELRDYRYFADDMCHPSDLAVEYIWNAFTQTYLTSTTQAVKKEIESFQSRLNHRSINPGSDEDKLFKAETLRIFKQLKQKYPDIHLPYK